LIISDRISMIGEKILHYPPKADLFRRRMSLWVKPLAEKILEKLGEGRLVRRNPTKKLRSHL